MSFLLDAWSSNPPVLCCVSYIFSPLYSDGTMMLFYICWIIYLMQVRVYLILAACLCDEAEMMVVYSSLLLQFIASHLEKAPIFFHSNN
jgi:hypothetical protein